jgi:predicted nucleic acid-binding protein
MNTYYVDTSVLVKIYHREAGTDLMLKLYHGTDKLLISELAHIELLSTVYRKYREHGITHDTLEAVIQKFEDDLDQRYELLRFASFVVDEAWSLLRRLAETHGLKTQDCLHFAFFKTYCDQTAIFACADTTLEKLVKAEGFQTFFPK